LGHPKEVLKALHAEHYKGVLAIQQVVMLVDARKLKDDRYTSHKIFNDQIGIAELVIGNKADLYQTGDSQRLVEYIKKIGKPQTRVEFSTQGNITLETLTRSTILSTNPLPDHKHNHKHSHIDDSSTSTEDQPLEPNDYVCKINQGEGFNSIGWRISSTLRFNRQKLFAWINRLVDTNEMERLKAVVITHKGFFSYNATTDGVSEAPLENCIESRIEIIAPAMNDSWQTLLLDCCEEKN
jgi:G3E family GTPase